MQWHSPQPLPTLRTLAGIALGGLALLLSTASPAQHARFVGTPVPLPSDCRTGGGCAPNQSPGPSGSQNVAAAMTTERAASAIAGYWAANSHASFLIFDEGDSVARLVEVVNGQVTRDRHATFTEPAPEDKKPGHLLFNAALRTTGEESSAPDDSNMEFYAGLHTVDINFASGQRLRLWFVRKVDQIDVDALEHPRAPAA